MYLKTLASLAGAAAYLASPVASFFRTTSDLGPNDYNYTFSGVPTIKDMYTYDEEGIKSYWFANFLKASNGHEYCIVATAANAGTGKQVTSLSWVDLTAGTYQGLGWEYAGNLSTTKVASSTPLLQVGAYSEDQFSTVFAISEVPWGIFNLTYQARGPIFAQAGLGTWLWGGKTSFSIDFPEELVTGTLTLTDGSVVEIVSEESSAYFDNQWGPGYAYDGWWTFLAAFDNGVKMVCGITFETSNYDQQAYCVFMHPSGFEEIHYIEPDCHPAKPWTSKQTGKIFYQQYTLYVPTAGAIIVVDCPLPSGETVPEQSSYTSGLALADTFAWFSGTWEGFVINGYGIAERAIPLS